jgi:DNA repair ATPase RecN
MPRAVAALQQLMEAKQQAEAALAEERHLRARDIRQAEALGGQLMSRRAQRAEGQLQEAQAQAGAYLAALQAANSRAAAAEERLQPLGQRVGAAEAWVHTLQQQLAAEAAARQAAEEELQRLPQGMWVYPSGTSSAWWWALQSSIQLLVETSTHGFYPWLLSGSTSCKGCNGVLPA